MKEIDISREDIKKNIHKYSFEIGNQDDANAIALVGRALSSPIRLEILRLLGNESLMLSEIAEKLDLPLSSTSFHLKILEESNLLGADYSVKRKGSVKWYTFTGYDLSITMRLNDEQRTATIPPFTQAINIGDYVDAEFSQWCGMASEKNMIMENEPDDAFNENRRDAQILWSRNYGHVEYAVSNKYASKGELSDINLSLELCTEAVGYNHNYPSDITFWINGVELCTYRCPGDFGNRYGKLTPKWWYGDSTKYGLLTTVSVLDGGVYLNGKLVNKNVNINSLCLAEGNRTSIKIGIKETAVHKGGFNLFGDKFGDYDQAIVFNAVYKSKK